MIYDSIIIGGGPAGMTAALYLARNNFKVALLEEQFILGGQIVNTTHLENFPTIEDISGIMFAQRMEEQIEDKIEIYYGATVINVEKVDEKFKIITDSNEEYIGKTLIIANGVKPRKLGLTNEEEFLGNGIYTCATCDGPLFKDKNTYVVGDGASAASYALQLAQYASSVTILMLTDSLKCDQFTLKKIKENKKISLIKNVEVASLSGNGKLEEIKLRDAETRESTYIRTNNLFLAIGKIPNNEIYGKHDLVELKHGYIITDENMHTRTKGVFAAGDTRLKDCKQVVTACSDGATAGIEASKLLF